MEDSANYPPKVDNRTGALCSYLESLGRRGERRGEVREKECKICNRTDLNCTWRGITGRRERGKRGERGEIGIRRATTFHDHNSAQMN